MCGKEENQKDELVTLQKADKSYIRKIKECNERWQKVIKEAAIKEGWI